MSDEKYFVIEFGLNQTDVTVFGINEKPKVLEHVNNFLNDDEDHDVCYELDVNDCYSGDGIIVIKGIQLELQVARKAISKE
jgi:hypothetical protein